MELVSLTKKPKSHKEANRYFESLSTLRLSEMRKSYNNLSDDCKPRIMWRMSNFDESDSDNLVLLHRAAIWLPPEVQHKIFMYMFENMFGNKKIKHIKDDKEIVAENSEEETNLIQKMEECNRRREKIIDLAAQKFYQEPIGKMLILCNEIKNNIRECDSVAFVFIMSEQERNDFYRELNPFYSSIINPVLSIEEQKAIHELDEEKQSYFIGRQVSILPEDDDNWCTPKKACFIAGGVSAGGAVMGGSLIGGAACIYGKTCVCEATFLGTVLGVTLGFIPCMGCVFAAAFGGCTLCVNHKKDTL